MLLMSWGLDCLMFEGDSVAGPIPTLFGEDITASKAAISANSERAFSDYQRLVRAFFMPETLQLEEAPGFVKKPRLDLIFFHTFQPQLLFSLRLHWKKLNQIMYSYYTGRNYIR